MVDSDYVENAHFMQRKNNGIDLSATPEALRSMFAELYEMGRQIYSNS